MSINDDISEKLNYLLAFEKAGKHHDLIFYGINVWPIVRSELQFNILRKDDWFQKQKLVDVIKLSWLKKIKTHFSLKRQLAEIERQIKTLKLKETDVLLFSFGNAYYTDTIDGKLYNRHIDPFLEELGKLNIKASKFHILNTDELSNKFFSASSLLLKREYQDFIWHYSFFLTSKFHHSNLEVLLNELGVNVNSFYRRVRFILSLKEIFKIVLKRIQPKKIGVVCFYDVNSFAMILAAKELGIKTFDIQHGKQGSQHFCYSHLVNAKGRAKDLMPDFFWNWGPDSCNNIQQFLLDKLDVNCIAGGNLWMSKWKNSEFYFLNEDENIYIENLKKYDKAFLYSAQPLNDYVMPNFFKAIIKNHPTYFFGIRLHPRDKVSLDKYVKEFEEFPNVEIKLSTEMPLYYLLKHMDFSITRWSSVALEALYFSCASMLVDPFGIESFKTYVEKGLIHSVLSYAEFDKVKLIGKSENNRVENSIILDSKIISSRLKELLN
jgi:hypothetical protein